MKYRVVLFSISMAIFVLSSCGSDPVADGDTAYAEGKYGPAINYYLQAKKGQPENTAIDEKIALCYMKRGQGLYARTKNLDSFSGNFEKGEGFIPAVSSQEFEKEYSKLLFQLAYAYYKTAPSNEIQKEQYFTKTLDYLELASANDPGNTSADSLLAAIKHDNFQRMYDKGVGFYQQAKKENTNELFLSAETYLKRAVFFNPDSKEAKKYLKMTREETLKILDTDQDFPIAVAAMKRMGDFLLVDLTGLNNSGNVIEFDPAKISLLDEAGNSYTFNPEETAKYESGLTKVTSLKARDRIDGIVAIAIGKSVQPAILAYQLDESMTSKKYLP